MDELSIQYYRGSTLESEHKILCSISSFKNKLLETTKGNALFFPRSSIKVFQAIPFASSGAIDKFKLNKKQIALSCSSHNSEEFHINQIKNWIKKCNLKVSHLKCGSHLPLDEVSKYRLIKNNNFPNALNNNCSGKHLAMLSACLANNKEKGKYLEFNHHHQKKIREIINLFIEAKIRKINYGIDGCGAPQYSLSYNNIINALKNLIRSYNNKFEFFNETNILIRSILNYPKFIGGTHNLDSNLIKISNKKLFCKGGAEGVFLFAHLETKIVGVLKVKDGNSRALPNAMYAICKKFKLLSKNELINFKKFVDNKIYNHANKKVGKIITVLK